MTVFNWVPPNPFFVLLPWLGLGLLYLWKPNRCVQAWWLLLAGGAVLLLRFPLGRLLASGDTQVQEMFQQCSLVLVYALAGLWLLAPGVSSKYRFLSFLFSALAMALLGGVALGTCTGVGKHFLTLLAALFFLGFGVLGLFLGGWFARRRYSPGRLAVCLSAGVVVAVSLVLGPIMGIVGFLNGFRDWKEMLATWGIAAGFVLVHLLPFVLLSMLNCFYRERLRDLLGIRPRTAASEPPPMLEGSKVSLEPNKIS